MHALIAIFRVVEVVISSKLNGKQSPQRYQQHHYMTTINLSRRHKVFET